tara:strand:+ start:350 stop:763 length:414 start_codon:yes stop_codon:yes gene_type:complete
VIGDNVVDTSTRKGRLDLLQKLQTAVLTRYLESQKVPAASVVANATSRYFNEYGGGRAMIEAGETILDFIENGEGKSADSPKPRKMTKAERARRKNMSSAMKTVRPRYFNKNGRLKKGKSQSDYMRACHRECKRMCK